MDSEIKDCGHSIPSDTETDNMGTAPQGQRLLGKRKYITEYSSIAASVQEEEGTCGLFLLYSTRETGDISLTYREAATGLIYVSKYTDEELASAKAAAGVSAPWPAFFKSIATAVLKSSVRVTTVSPVCKEARFDIKQKILPDCVETFTVALNRVDDAEASNGQALYECVMEPLIRALQYCYRLPQTRGQSRSWTLLESEILTESGLLKKYRDTVSRLMPFVQPLRAESVLCAQRATAISREVCALGRRIHSLEVKKTLKHPLDKLYSDGGVMKYVHSVHSVEHFPLEEPPDDVLTACIRAAFPLGPGAHLDDITNVMHRPELADAIALSGQAEMIKEVLEILKGLDRWDYNVIRLESITDGKALFYTTYALMYKLNLVAHFGIDDAVLQAFLVGVQSSYHPNPYHNAMHAADVTQVNYYITVVGGLRDRCQLSEESMLASILAATIHDFDHPGLNNNFHSRSNAYLAILYNDRSVLENHHLASSFELMRHPRYNVLASLSEAQRQAVREVMLELVFATDLGCHGALLSRFQLCLSEATEWHTKENARLAMCMSIKMADISNCARPFHIYSVWARNTCAEFYRQGDAERQLQLSISPFMDRMKETEEFPKGQIAFMTYVVLPLTEAMAELLPSLTHTVKHCKENLNHWLKQVASTKDTV